MKKKLAADAHVLADLIDMLKSYGNSIDGFRERVGDDFARGHKEATGGIIARVSIESTRLGHCIQTV